MGDFADRLKIEFSRNMAAFFIIALAGSKGAKKTASLNKLNILKGLEKQGTKTQWPVPECLEMLWIITYTYVHLCCNVCSRLASIVPCVH